MSLWQMYCIPGRVLAFLSYLYPSRGHLWSSARQRNSTFHHFLLSSAIYAAAIFGVVALIAGAFRSSNPLHTVASASVPTPPATLLTETSATPGAVPTAASPQNATTEAAVPTESNAEIPLAPDSSSIRVAGATAVADDASASNGSAISPDRTPALKLAIHDALEVGGPRRWTAGPVSGSVQVGPVVEDGDGLLCRTFSYQVGESPPTAPLAVCRQGDGRWTPQDAQQ